MSGNRGKGRPPGAKNKTTLKVKAALNAVYDKRGGDKALLAWSDENPTEFYKLWGKQLPQELSGPDGAAVQVLHQIVLRGVRSDADR